LLATFGKLAKALTYAYPETNWNEVKLAIRHKKSGQRWLSYHLPPNFSRWLWVSVKELFPSHTRIYEEYLLPSNK
jgi:hypothetical protein